MSNRSGERRHPRLIAILTGKHDLPLECLTVALFQVEQIFLHSSFAESHLSGTNAEFCEMLFLLR